MSPAKLLLPSLILFVFSLTPALGAEVSTSSAQKASCGESPVALASGDFDGDGSLDLASANWGARTLGLHRGHGDGRFHAEVAIPLEERPAFVARGDFDENGRLDLVVVEDLFTGADRVRMLLGDGAGGFTTSAVLPTADGPIWIAVADVDRDGHQDILVPGKESDAIAIHLGDGSGGLGPAIAMPVGVDPWAVATGDFDGDGNADLAVGEHAANTVSIHLGDGAGGFSLRESHAFLADPYGLIVVDLDDDGILDLAIGDGSGRVHVLRGIGSGGFGAAETWVAAPSGAGCYDIVAADLDGDGIVDLATANGEDGGRDHEISVLLGDGTGSFTVARYIGGASPRDLVAVDLDEDGRIDLVTANQRGDDLSILLGDATGTYDRLPPLLPVADSPVAIATGDFDNDGCVDLAHQRSDGEGVVRMLPGNGLGGFGAPIDYAGFSSISWIHPTDLDGDGSLDLVILDDDLYPHIEVALGDGAFGFGPATRYDFNSNIRELETIDIDRDGNVDLVATSEFPYDCVMVVPGDGTGSLGEPSYYRLGAGTSFLSRFTLQDLDEDGHLDAAVSTWLDERVVILLGDGQGGFVETPTILDTDGDIWSIDGGDLTGDGHADLVVGIHSSIDYFTALYPGDGTGGFGSRVLLPYYGLEQARDIDRDGDLDLVVRDVDRTGVLVAVNDGSGGFETFEFLTDRLVHWIAVADFAADGRDDYAVAYRSTDGITVLLDDTFDPPTIQACKAGTVRLADGDPSDVLFLNSGAGDERRAVRVGAGEPIVGTIELPPAGGSGKFVIHADAGVPSLEGVTPLPAGIGATCFPFLIPRDAAPIAIWNGQVGKVHVVGPSTYFDGEPIPDPETAPETWLDLPSGDTTYLPPGTIVTFQAAMKDPGSPSRKRASVSNAVILVVE